MGTARCSKSEIRISKSETSTRFKIHMTKTGQTDLPRHFPLLARFPISVILLRWLLAGLLIVLGGPSSAEDPQTRTGETPSVSQPALRLTKPQTERWQFGVVVRAQGLVTGIVATLPVPMPWPEQDVKIIDQQSSRQVRSVRFKVLEDGVKQMSVSIPRLAAGDEAAAVVTMEIVKRDMVAPLSTPGSTYSRQCTA